MRFNIADVAVFAGYCVEGRSLELNLEACALG